MFSSKYFTLGSQVVSQKISIELLENKLFAIEIFKALERFCDKDWGEMGEEDKAIAQFIRVNKCSYADYVKALGRANEIHRRRNEIPEWSVNLEYLKKFT